VECWKTTGTQGPGSLFGSVIMKWDDRDAMERAIAHANDLAARMKPDIEEMVRKIRDRRDLILDRGAIELSELMMKYGVTDHQFLERHTFSSVMDGVSIISDYDPVDGVWAIGRPRPVSEDLNKKFLLFINYFGNQDKRVTSSVIRALEEDKDLVYVGMENSGGCICLVMRSTRRGLEGYFFIPLIKNNEYIKFIYTFVF
jgi:hypothetical protein